MSASPPPSPPLAALRVLPPAAESGVKLFHWPDDIECQQVHMALLEASVPVDLHRVDVERGEQFAPQFVRALETPRLPFLSHRGRFVGLDTLSLLRYIVQTFGARDEPTSLLPSSPSEIAAIDRWMDELVALPVAALSLSIPAGLWGRSLRADMRRTPAMIRARMTHSLPADDLALYQRLLEDTVRDVQSLERDVNDPATVAQLAACLDRMHAELVRTGHAFLGGDAFSLVDAAWAPLLAFVDRHAHGRFFGAQTGAPRSSIAAYLARVAERASFRAAVGAVGPVGVGARVVRTLRRNRRTLAVSVVAVAALAFVGVRLRRWFAAAR